MNPLNSIKGTLIAGFVLAIVVAFALNMGLGTVNWLTVFRWIHILAGITWIGLLYYFNFVQTPAWLQPLLTRAARVVPASLNTSPHGRSSGSAGPPALTWLMGVAYLGYRNSLGAFALGFEKSPVDNYELTIGVGAWLGTIMLFNVWVLIWPNQKKILGIVSATDEQKAKARKIAALASRTNTMLSIPMLLCMASASHGLPPHPRLKALSRPICDQGPAFQPRLIIVPSIYNDRPPMSTSLPTDISATVQRALAEDIGDGDLTAALSRVSTGPRPGHLPRGSGAMRHCLVRRGVPAGG